jgi:hypothetical protein
MPVDPPALQRARRLVATLLAGHPSVQLGSLTRDLERLDRDDAIAPGEIAIGRGVDVRLASRLLRERGYYRCGWNGGSGLHREPVYSLGHRPD